MKKQTKIRLVDLLTEDDALAERLMKHFKIREEGRHYFFDDSDPDYSPVHKFFGLSTTKLESFLRNYSPDPAAYTLMNSKIYEILYFDERAKKIVREPSRSSF